VAILAVAGRAAAQERLVQQAIDQATGAVVRLYETADGPRIDVAAAGLTIRKAVTGESVTTAIHRGKESLVIESGPSGLTVSGSAGRFTAPYGEQAAGARTKAMVAASPLAADAARLIGRMRLAGLPTVQPVLLTTRAFLLSAADDQSGVQALKAWMRDLRLRGRIVKAGGVQKTPTDCWNAYGDEILAAYDQFVDCVNNLAWWQWDTGVQKCSYVYDLRVLGASSWYAACVSLGWLFGK
jgi:hypothetical protein